MNIFELLAGIALFAGDLFVLGSVLGALALFVWLVVDLFTARRHKAPEIVVQWAFGALCLLSVFVVGWTQPLGQIFVRLNVASAAGLLVMALALIVASKVVDRLGDRRRQARSPAIPKAPVTQKSGIKLGKRVAKFCARMVTANNCASGSLFSIIAIG